MQHHLLESILLLLAAAVFAVVLCRSLRLPAMLGYLLVGMTIGPFSLKLIESSPVTNYLGEFGVVFLMFSIGLEFNLGKLKAMRYQVFGLGLLQVLTCMLLFATVSVLLGTTWQVALAIGGILSLSSTAIVSKLMTERQEIHTPHGGATISILLFQDLAVVPLLILLPALGQSADQLLPALGFAAIKIIVVLSILLFVGQKLMRPWLHIVAKQRSTELFMINILLLTLGVGWLTEQAGLSLALGAFVAGILIAETEYRYQVEEDIKPFRDILLGLFFISIGMRLDFQTAFTQWQLVSLFFVVLLLGKGGLIWVLSRLTKHNPATATRTALALAQGGEFGFVLLSVTNSNLAIAPNIEQSVLAAMVLSMLSAPFLFPLADKIVTRYCGSEWLNLSAKLHEVARRSLQQDNHVIICGYGRSGQQLARLLQQEKCPIFALDLDPVRVKEAAAAGDSVVYGDAAKLEVLLAAGLQRARALIVSYADTHSALKILHLVHAERPDLPIIVRTQDTSSIEILRAAGATEVVAEIMECSLMLASHTLMLLGTPLNQVSKRIQHAREQQYHLLQGFFRGESDELDLSDTALEPRLHSITLTLGNPNIGKTHQEVNIESTGCRIHAIRRHGIQNLQSSPELIYQQNDIIILLGNTEQVAAAEFMLLQN